MDHSSSTLFYNSSLTQSPVIGRSIERSSDRSFDRLIDRSLDHSMFTNVTDSSLCQNWEVGRCSKGASCKFMHLSPQTIASNQSDYSAKLNNYIQSNNQSNKRSDQDIYAERLVSDLESFNLDSKPWSIEMLSRTNSPATNVLLNQLNQSIMQSNNHSINQSNNHINNQLNNQSLLQSTNQSLLESTNSSVGLLSKSRSGSQNSLHSNASNNLSVNMFDNGSYDAYSFADVHSNSSQSIGQSPTASVSSFSSPRGDRADCWDWLSGRCTRGSLCKFSHSSSSNQLNSQSHNQTNQYSDHMCHQWSRAGHCQYGDLCKFVHYNAYQSNDQSNHRSSLKDNLFDHDQSLHQPINHSLHGSPFQTMNQSLFREPRLGLDTEICRFFAKNSRCKYGLACKFVHINHQSANHSNNQSNNQSSNPSLRTLTLCGVNVTWSELQRLCTLHGLTSFPTNNQSINQSINQDNQLNHQNQSSQQSNNQSINQTRSQSPHMYKTFSPLYYPRDDLDRSINHSMHPPISQRLTNAHSASNLRQQSPRLSIQSINQTLSQFRQSPPLPNQVASHESFALIDQSNNQSYNQSINQLNKQAMIARPSLNLDGEQINQPIDESNDLTINFTSINQSNNHSNDDDDSIFLLRSTSLALDESRGLIGQSINRSNNQSVNQSNNGGDYILSGLSKNSLAQSINQSVGHSPNHLIKISTQRVAQYSQFNNQMNNQSISQSINRTINQSPNRSPNRSVRPSINLSDVQSVASFKTTTCDQCLSVQHCIGDGVLNLCHNCYQAIVT